MFGRSKRFVVAAALTTLAASAVPVARSESALAMAPCQVKPLFSVIEWQQTVAVYGFYNAPGALEVELTCGVVRYGSTAATVTDATVGPSAVVATTTTVGAGSVSACYEVVATYIDHTYSYDGCP